MKDIFSRLVCYFKSAFSDSIRIGGTFHYEHWRNGVLIDSWSESNLITNEGLDSILNVSLRAATQITAWYIGIFEANYTPVATVTAATITAASTESTAYAEATRPVFTSPLSTARSLTNTASKATFTINATKTVYGAFLVSSSAKSGTTGVLMAASKNAVARAVVSGDILTVDYTVNIASA